MAPFAGLTLGRTFLDLFLPPACASCGSYLPAIARPKGEQLCLSCRSRLKVPPHPRCPRCAAPRGTGLPESRQCRECHDWPDYLLSARAATLLAPPADTLVHQFKYGGWPELALEMAERLARVVQLDGCNFQFSVLVPIPTTPRRRRVRGYNQAAVLARALAPRLGLPLVEALARREGGKSQVSLDRGARRQNVRQAFHLLPEHCATLVGREVVLVDDVLTTGATALAAAETLVQGGASGVHLLTFARSLPD